ncbi:zinc finger CCCH domain-containing protein 38-like isoform X2 [Trifolium pratense]|uniref:zinc finger CCCH domain-containing protein 38-like isoform X2 n=1 Tax=Trifolium pratense TaxID=57577 RepID=UPI001E6958F7|nr:zinc finger CCCH domain-containing protein 38-like isoform X2 [Trifolium pratense]XP_045823669.1 zinc finger CCCH domain-containing protein 38-like isoform X2 [Trifolium pratense]XP_045823670.1 zinc finger CCCH domain-containing protein 38-like isoform X2 [Trifolium pratense]
MSETGRKRSSKWDLSDEHRQMRSGWSSADVAGNNSSKWAYSEGNDKLRPVMGYSSKESFSGGRGSYEDDAMNEDHRILDTRREWNTDGSYSKKRSPWQEEWEPKRRSQSPINGWNSRSRSQSRSPPRGFRRDSGIDDRKRMRVVGSTRPCRDFAVGKCRRGSLCNFLHHDNQNRENSWEGKHREDRAPRYSATHERGDHSLKSGRSMHDNDSDGYGKVSMDEFTREREDRAPRYPPHEDGDRSLKRGRSSEVCTNFAKGRCRMGTSCKFVHDNDSDGYGKVCMDEFTRDREIDRRHRDNSFEQGGRHVPNRTSDTPCKFFANGNCRNGKFCKFSHDRQACRSPNRRLRDDRWARNPGRDHQMLDRQKWSDSMSPNRRPRDDRWGSDGDVADPDRVGDSPKRNNKVSVSDTTKLIENKSGNVDATDPGFTTLSVTDGYGHELDKSELHGKPPISSDTKEADCWIEENTGGNMHGSHSIVTKDIWPGDAEMSPDWNYKTGPSSHMEEPGQNKHGIRQGGTYLAISEPDRVQLAPGQSINQNAQNVNPLHTSSCHEVEQSQVDVPILPSSGGIVDATHRQEVSTEKKYTVEPNITDSGLSQVRSINPPTQNAVSNEQLAQLTTSLAHILGAGQQLPQLYAALNSHDLKDSPSQAKTQVPAMPVSITCINPVPAVGFPKQYGPVNDSIEQKNADASGVPPAIPPSKNIAEVEILSQLSNPGKQNCGDSIKGASSELVKSDNLIHLQPGQNTVVNKDNNEEVAKERKNSEDGHKSTKENGPQNTDQNARPDDAKQTKEMKGIRTFKFALAEFVKELLKPAWKEGQITNKEDYKTIVKKVLDKVTATMQAANIPQTQEKIDQYLSFSKPKLNKLVQAYVEKVQKPQ